MDTQDLLYNQDSTDEASLAFADAKKQSNCHKGHYQYNRNDYIHNHSLEPTMSESSDVRSSHIS